MRDSRSSMLKLRLLDGAGGASYRESAAGRSCAGSHLTPWRKRAPHRRKSPLCVLHGKQLSFALVASGDCFALEEEKANVFCAGIGVDTNVVADRLAWLGKRAMKGDIAAQQAGHPAPLEKRV